MLPALMLALGLAAAGPHHVHHARPKPMPRVAAPRIAAPAALVMLAPPAPILSAAQITVPRTESDLAAWLADAREYARHYDVPLAQAIGELELQEATVHLTDSLRTSFRARFASVYIDHKPKWRIVVRLTGDEPVDSQTPIVAGRPVIIDFKVGAPATEAQMIAAIERNEPELQAALPHPPGIGINPRTGLLIAIARGEDIDKVGARNVAKKLEAIAGIPFDVRSWADSDKDLSIAAGSVFGRPPVVAGGRALGLDPRDGKRYLCTTGFAVTDGRRTAITTAAHCPDALDFVDRDKSEQKLQLLGAWGARYQDVQIQAASTPLEPLVRADDPDRPRAVTGWRNRGSTRAGDFVCHRGERTGYSCSEVKFVDYAPPGDLCAGPCPALWVAVKGPHCKSGDSGGPVFVGTVAFGLTKGASYTADGVCKLYYYMSTDYLPPGWRLLYRPSPASAGTAIAGEPPAGGASRVSSATR